MLVHILYLLLVWFCFPFSFSVTLQLLHPWRFFMPYKFSPTNSGVYFNPFASLHFKSDRSNISACYVWIIDMRIETSGLTRAATCASAFFESEEDRKPDAKSSGDHALPVKVSDDKCSMSSSSTSSIGRNSDLSSERSMGDEDCGENEAQSAYNGPLDMMQSLEEVLPISRGISKFYNGKSKSFTSLADASASPSVKDIAKPQNAYTRKRRNLMAFNHVWNKNRSFPLRSNNGGISKRTILSTSRSALALAVARNNSDSSSCTSEDSNSRSPPPLPPLYPRINVFTTTSAGPCSPLHQSFSAWRSFSLADLQHCATAATMNMSSSSSLGSETALSKLT